jgi:hypothetical protein
VCTKRCVHLSLQYKVRRKKEHSCSTFWICILHTSMQQRTRRGEHVDKRKKNRLPNLPKCYIPDGSRSRVGTLEIFLHPGAVASKLTPRMQVADELVKPIAPTNGHPKVCMNNLSHFGTDLCLQYGLRITLYATRRPASLICHLPS